MSTDERWVRFSAVDAPLGRVDPEKMKLAKERIARGEMPYDPDWGSPTTAEDIEASLALIGKTSSRAARKRRA